MSQWQTTRQKGTRLCDGVIVLCYGMLKHNGLVLAPDTLDWSCRLSRCACDIAYRVTRRKVGGARGDTHTTSCSITCCKKRVSCCCSSLEGGYKNGGTSRKSRRDDGKNELTNRHISFETPTKPTCHDRCGFTRDNGDFKGLILQLAYNMRITSGRSKIRLQIQPSLRPLLVQQLLHEAPT